MFESMIKVEAGKGAFAGRFVVVNADGRIIWDALTRDGAESKAREARRTLAIRNRADSRATRSVFTEPNRWQYPETI